jgi:hypothetical protein
MDNARKDAAVRDVPVTFYRLIQQQTRPPRTTNGATLLACAIFVIVAALLVLSLELGADIEQILIAAFAIAVVNLVFAVSWMAATRRT